MTDHQPNHKRNRPSVSFTLPTESVSYLDELAKNFGRPKSYILEKVIDFHMDKAGYLPESTKESEETM